MKLRNCFFTFILLATPSLATTQFEVSEQSYETVDLAAVAALEAIQSVSPVYEYGGLVLSCASGVVYTKAMTDRDPHHFALKGLVPVDCKIAGIYHTHPGTEKSAEKFSFDDVVIAARLKVPTYVLVLQSGHLIALDQSTVLMTLDKNAQYHGIDPSRTLSY